MTLQVPYTLRACSISKEPMGTPNCSTTVTTSLSNLTCNIQILLVYRPPDCWTQSFTHIHCPKMQFQLLSVVHVHSDTAHPRQGGVEITPFVFEGTLFNYLSSFTTNAAGKLNVLWHDGHTLGVDGCQVGVLKQANQVSLSCLLKS